MLDNFIIIVVSNKVFLPQLFLEMIFMSHYINL